MHSPGAAAELPGLTGSRDRSLERGWKLILGKSQTFGEWEGSLGAFPFLCSWYGVTRYVRTYQPHFFFLNARCTKCQFPIGSQVFSSCAFLEKSLYCPVPLNGQLQSCVCGWVIPGCAQGTARHCHAVWQHGCLVTVPRQAPAVF